jgi:hypothetical protein
MRHHWEADFSMKCQEMSVNGVDVNLEKKFVISAKFTGHPGIKQ